METKRAKLNHDGVFKNSDDYYKEMKSVVKRTDTIPLAVSSDVFIPDGVMYKLQWS